MDSFISFVSAHVNLFGTIVGLLAAPFIILGVQKFFVRVRGGASEPTAPPICGALDDLCTAIHEDDLKELEFIEWIRPIGRRPSQQLDAGEASIVVGRRDGIIREMRSKDWSLDTITLFAHRFWDLRAKDFGRLFKPKKQ